ncbi:MAG TPA: DUF1801 domain-containing protein [Allosphingosinicella sp.]|nr:DUF1801 domain-containing protein [Allosphingosinicella sp.]
MAENKTKPTEVPVDEFLDAVADPQRREDGRRLCAMMERISGYPAKMWGPSIVGFGLYRYRYDSGHGGEMCRLGFSPRDRELVLYLAVGYERHQPLMDRLGKHRTGKACVYIKRLADVDEQVLEELIRESLDYMRQAYPEEA